MTVVDPLWQLVKARALADPPWSRLGRPEQQLPDDPWRIVYFQGGRGSGKTRSGAEGLATLIRRYPKRQWACVAPTYGDVRDTMIEGESSGLLSVMRLPRTYAGWNRSMGKLILPDGSIVWADGADDGAKRIQGKNLAGAWCDEIGLWMQWRMAWEESLAFAVRMEPARLIVTGTPKMGHALVGKLLADPACVVRRMRTRDNVANLSALMVAELEERYGGTRLGRQELEGEFLEDTEGALWTTAMIELSRWKPRWVMPNLTRRVVAVDPAVTATEGSDETGIVVAAIGPCECKGSGTVEPHGFVFEDRSGQYSPESWAQVAVRAYWETKADRLIAEVNKGGDIVESVLRMVDRNVAVKKTTATRGKRLRAEPVAALYEQGKVHHVGIFDDMEHQMTTYTGMAGEDSPDRLDALVYALTELFDINHDRNSAGVVGVLRKTSPMRDTVRGRSRSPQSPKQRAGWA